jgi:tetratricopeptide (TPR) repeat protein
LGMKNKLALAKALCIVVLLSLVLVSCSSTTGPVAIRDSTNIYRASIDRVSTGRGSTSHHVDGNSTSTDKKIAMVDPVLANTKKIAMPIIERLAEQANLQYKANNYKQAINTAERGLRINRREARFYLTLTKAHKRLNNTRQAVFFARQGLRYAQKNSSIFSELKKMAAG